MLDAASSGTSTEIRVDDRVRRAWADKEFDTDARVALLVMRPEGTIGAAVVAVVRSTPEARGWVQLFNPTSRPSAAAGALHALEKYGATLLRIAAEADEATHVAYAVFTDRTHTSLPECGRCAHGGCQPRRADEVAGFPTGGGQRAPAASAAAGREARPPAHGAHARERQRNQPHTERILQGDAPPMRTSLSLGGFTDHKAEQIFTAFRMHSRRVARKLLRKLLRAAVDADEAAEPRADRGARHGRRGALRQAVGWRRGRGRGAAAQRAQAVWGPTPLEGLQPVSTLNTFRNTLAQAPTGAA